MSEQDFQKNVGTLAAAMMQEFDKKEIPMNIAAFAMIQIIAIVMGAQDKEFIDGTVESFKNLCYRRYDDYQFLKAHFDGS
jgi:hypothetical protein